MKKVTKTTCILPWISLDRNSDTSTPAFSPCCLYQSKEPKYDFNEYWNGDELKQVRQEMTEGQKPAGCWKCYNDEDLGKKSMRQSVNESRLVPHSDLIEKESSELKPLQVKLLAGASCNLACRMCVSHVSSKVHKVWEAIGLPSKDPYKYDDVSEQIIKQNASSVRYIDLMGGEPFYNKRVQNLIQWLVDGNHAHHITVYVTTNAMLLNDRLISNLKQFENVVVIVSLDAVGKKHEYIRPGAVWKTIVSNIEKLQSNKLNVLIQPVISAINILCLPELIEWCNKRKLHMTQMSLVHEPVPLHPKNLPSSLKPLVDPRFHSFIQEASTDSSIEFIKKLDSYWNTKIYDYMPEWRDVCIKQVDKNQMERDYDLYRRTLDHVGKI
jgi:MoaA/NifB/PqqE/SkfB family radical SAM enzyme